MSSISSATSQASAALNMAQSQIDTDKLSGLAKKVSSLSEDDLAKIDKTAQDFEAVFVTEMMKPMFNMIKVDDEFGGGKGEEVFRGFLLNEYGKDLAQKGGFGIAPQVKAQLIRMQEETATKTVVPEL